MTRYHNIKSNIVLKEDPCLNEPFLVKASVIPNGNGTDLKMLALKFTPKMKNTGMSTWF